MRVKRVSFVFHIALKKPGTPAQIAPAIILASNMIINSNHEGNESFM
jgi:hypothetical protein